MEAIGDLFTEQTIKLYKADFKKLGITDSTKIGNARKYLFAQRRTLKRLIDRYEKPLNNFSLFETEYQLLNKFYKVDRNNISLAVDFALKVVNLIEGLENCIRKLVKTKSKQVREAQIPRLEW